MKKKFILIFSMVALVVCLFAISVSATNYLYTPNTELSDLPSSFYVSSSVVFTDSLYSNGIDKNFERLFGYQKFYFELADSSYSDDSIIVFDIDNLHEFLLDFNIDTLEEFESFDSLLLENYLIPYDFDEHGNLIAPDSFFAFNWYADYELVWNAYQSYVAEITAPTYEDGKIEGVTEFKASEEYENTINEAEQNAIDGFKSSVEYNAMLQGEYNRGKDEAVENYKSSPAYKNVLDVKYQTGLADGKSNYIESNEYIEALQGEYDKGF